VSATLVAYADLALGFSILSRQPFGCPGQKLIGLL
jgi:hypothetical protein